MFTHTALQRAIARSHEGPIATMGRVDEGQNHTYRVTLQDGRERFLKVGTRFPKLFEAEPATMALVRRETDLPVPEVVATGREPLGYPFAVYEFVPDTDADWVRDLEPHVAQCLCREAGRNLAALHEVTFPQFGRLGPTGDGLAVVDPRPYEDVLRRSLERQLDELCETPLAPLRDRIEARGVELVDATELDDFRPTLVHGDYRIDNLCVDPAADTVTRAVLDWELPTAGDPLWDAVMTRTLLGAGYGITPEQERELDAAFWAGYGTLNYGTARRRLYELLARLRLARHLDVEMQGLPDAAQSERVAQHRDALEALLDGGTALRRSTGAT